MEKRNRRKLRKQFESAPLVNYTPASTANGLYGAYLSSYLDGKPWFIPYRDVPRMMRDAQVLQGLQARTAILVQAKWKVKSKDEAVAKFVDSTIGTLWKKVMPKIMEDYFTWGYSPSVMTFEMDKDNKVKLLGGRVIPPSLALPRVMNKPGKDYGKYVGFDLSGAQGIGRDDGQFIAVPHAFWFAGNERRCEFFDNSLLMGAFVPWLEKNERGQGLAARQLYFRRCAFSLGSLYHPLGETSVNGVMVDNRDLATYISDNIQNGWCMIFPDTRTPDDNRNEPQWRFEPGSSNSDNSKLIEYIHELDKEISIGLGIPPEVLEASEVGSGWSGRAIPRDMLFCASDRIVSQFLDSFDLQVLRDMVAYNFGENAEYELDAIPLVESMNPQNQQQQQPPGMPGGMPGMPQQAGEPPQEEGGGGELDALIEQLSGDSTGDGEGEFNMKLEKGGKIPYVGKRGGKGVKDPKTGRIDYLSHKSDRQYGCVLCPAPQYLADMSKGFASMIPHDELADEGVEPEPHVTVRYGLHGSDCETVFKATEPLGSLRFTPGSLQCFALPDYDVLYISCDNESDWHNWHNSLEKIPNTLTHEDYIPHMTLAYLKPGCGSKYVGRTDLVADPVDMERVVYSKPDGSREERLIWPSAEQLEMLFSSVTKPVMMSRTEDYKQRFITNGSGPREDLDPANEEDEEDEEDQDDSVTINQKSATLNNDGSDKVATKTAPKPKPSQSTANPPLPFVPKPKTKAAKPATTGVNPTTKVEKFTGQTPPKVDPYTGQVPPKVKHIQWVESKAAELADKQADELAGDMDRNQFSTMIRDAAKKAMQQIGEGDSIVHRIKLPNGRTVKMTLKRKTNMSSSEFQASDWHLTIA